MMDLFAQDLIFVEIGSIEPSSICLATILVLQKSLCFSPILLDSKGLEEKSQTKSFDDEPCNSSLTTTTVVPRSKCEFSHINQLSTKIHFSQNKTLRLMGQTASRLDYRRKELQGRLSALSLSQEDQVLTQIMNQPEVNGLAGVLKEKLIHFAESKS